jgi:CRP/FNR family nitrogen fixation transcriptional regulator
MINLVKGQSRQQMGKKMITLSTARAKLADASYQAIAALRMPDVSQRASLSDYLQTIQDYGSRQHFDRNESIFIQGDAADRVYRLVSGTVRLCRHAPDGRRHIVEFLLPGDLMGFVESPEQPVSAEAVSDVTVVAYPRACFDRLAAESAAVRSQLLCHLSENLQSAQQHQFVLGCQKAKERVSSFLLRLAERMDILCGDRVDLPMSRQDIADHLGLTIETISRAISALRGDGVLLVPNAHQLILRDMAMLRAFAAEG